MRHLLLFSLLSACGPGLVITRTTVPDTDDSDDGGPDDASDTTPPDDSESDDEAETEDDTGDLPPAGPPPTLQELYPSYGTDAGGTEVTILGTGLRDADVTFNGVPATVESSTNTQIVVLTPPNPGEDVVDVVVSHRGGSAQLVGAYQYWPDGAGLTGGFAVIGRERLVGGYWGAGTPPFDQPYAWAQVEFFEPVDLRYWQIYAAQTGGCSHNYYWQGRISHYALDAASLSLSHPSQSIVLRPSDTVPDWNSTDPDLYMSIVARAADVPTNIRFSLDPFVSAGNWPGFGIPDVVQAVPSFDITVPNVGSTSMPEISRTIDVAWSGAGGDYMILRFLHYAWPLNGPANDPPNLVQILECVVPDNGRYTVNAAQWPQWRTQTENYYDYMEIHAARVQERRFTLPHNGSELSGIGAAWVVGAAWMLR